MDVSLLRLGNFVIAAVPGEFTTMAGRRTKAAITEAAEAAWGPNVTVGRAPRALEPTRCPARPRGRRFGAAALAHPPRPTPSRPRSSLRA